MVTIFNNKITLSRYALGAQTTSVSVCGKASCASVSVKGVDVDRLERDVVTFLRAAPPEDVCDSFRRLGDTQPYVVMCNPELAGVQGAIGGDPMETSCTQDAAFANCQTCHLNAPSCNRNWESPANGCVCCY